MPEAQVHWARRITASSPGEPRRGSGAHRAAERQRLRRHFVLITAFPVGINGLSILDERYRARQVLCFRSLDDSAIAEHGTWPG